MSCMRNWYECLVEDPFRYKKPVHLYFVFCVICFIASFLGLYPLYLISKLSAEFNDFLGIFVYSEIGRRFLVGAMLIYPISLLTVYLIAIFCKHYMPLILLTNLHVVYSAFALPFMIFNHGFTFAALLMIIKIILDLWFGMYFISVWKYLR